MHERLKLIAAGALTSLCLLLTGHWIYRSLSSTPVPEKGSVTQEPAIRERSATRAAKRADDRLTLDDVRLKVTESQPYQGSGRNIFLSYVKNRRKGIRPPPGQQPTPPPLRTTTAMQLKAFGFATRLSLPKKVFLSKDADVFIASEGEIVDRRYKIVRIGPSSVDVEDLVENHLYSLTVQPG